MNYRLAMGISEIRADPRLACLSHARSHARLHTSQLAWLLCCGNHRAADSLPRAEPSCKLEDGMSPFKSGDAGKPRKLRLCPALLCPALPCSARPPPRGGGANASHPFAALGRWKPLLDVACTRPNQRNRLVKGPLAIFLEMLLLVPLFAIHRQMTISKSHRSPNRRVTHDCFSRNGWRTRAIRSSRQEGWLPDDSTVDDLQLG